jgi:hypothetical protein
MATGRQLADTALAQARACLSSYLSDLTAQAAGDLEALRTAAELVRATHARLPERQRTVEHLAFSLLTAAYSEAVQQRQSDAAGQARQREA